MNKNDFCRTCMRSKEKVGPLRPLDSIVESNDETDTNTTLLDCFLFSTKLNNDARISCVICEECCRALQISYNFIRNALFAHEIWTQKLEMAARANEKKSNKAMVKFRCKLCGVMLFSKTELKNHGKMHAGELTYDCTACNFSTNQKHKLYSHYVSEHSIEPTAEQLKAKKISKAEDKDSSEHSIESMAEQSKAEDKDSSEHNMQNESQEETKEIPPETAKADNKELNTDANMTIGSEYIVLADGTLQALEDSNVLIEYIDTASNKLDPNIVQEEVMQKISTNMDIDKIVLQQLGELLILPQQEKLTDQEQEKQTVVEQNTITQEEKLVTATGMKPEENTNQLNIIAAESKNSVVSCRICSNTFPSLAELKTHMLNHIDIPQFFCDKCDFYTFYKIDIKQHYSAKHKLQPTAKQLEPKNKSRIAALNQKIYYRCNLCAHKTVLKDNLRRHYMAKHSIRTNQNCSEMYLVNGEIPKDNTIIDSEKTTTSTTKDAKNKVVITSLMKINGNASVNLNIKSLFSDESQEPPKSESSMDFDINGDGIFDDLMDTEEGTNNASSLLNSNVMLTSDEEDANFPKPTTNHKCNICKKTFPTYYKLENHMFKHRGLAPYHCEMCTNIYNTKFALLSHYLEIHGTQPTRDMLQPKGVEVNMANVDKITVNVGNNPTLLCGFCPFETKERVTLLEHLRLTHNTENDDYIFSKLLYECPRCVRSFATEVDLMQHLQRSHSVTSFTYAEPDVADKTILTSTENTPALVNGQTNGTPNSLETEHRCRLCSEPCNSIELLRKHVCKLFSQIAKI